MKKPSLIPISALACVMFSRKPSRSVTGAEEPAEAAGVLLVVDEPDEPHPAASAVTAATPAATIAFVIVRPLCIVDCFRS